MINQSTLELLKAMKLTAMANELQHQMEDPATYAALGFEDRLSLLTDAEWGRRQANKLARYIKMQLFLHQVQVSKALNTMTIVSWIKLRFFDMRPANTS